MDNLAVQDSSGCCCACGPDAASEQGGVAQVNVTVGWGPGPVPGGVTEGLAAGDCCDGGCCDCGCEGRGCC